MAHHRMGAVPEARTALANADGVARKSLPSLESGQIGTIWRDWIVANALLEEARQLIAGVPETPGGPATPELAESSAQSMNRATGMCDECGALLPCNAPQGLSQPASCAWGLT